MRTTLTTLALLALFAASCGGTAQDDTSVDTRSEALRCSEAPEVHDGIATSVGCSFNQQDYNVRKFGKDFGHAVELRDASGALVANVEVECEQWLLGQDAQGQTVIISKSTGEVRSHGSMHAGQAVSSLPGTVTLPLSYDAP